MHSPPPIAPAMGYRTFAEFSIMQIIEEISDRSKDVIIGVGEKLSCRIVTAILRDRVSAKPCFNVELK